MGRAPNPGPTNFEHVPNKTTYGTQFSDKLAPDRIGEELKPDACIWRLYAEEANEYDAEMVQERNKNLDTMLLFATLFSAIVTAFLIESTNLLEQDSSEVSAQLLLMLVRSQLPGESGTQNITPSAVDIPEFAPSWTVRFINVLWFASLMTSLGAAVVAMLAKEWLSSFISYRTRHAHEYALQRRARLASLSAWNMLPIIDLLPTLLNCALLVFVLGLIIRLWILDYAVAVVTTIISAAVCRIYLFFVIAGAVYESCPYKARLSAYIQRAICAYFTPIRTVSSYQPSYIKREEIDLLTWLFNSSSDPTLGNYVTQALAGLKSSRLGLPTFLDRQNAMGKLHEVYKNNHEIFAPLLGLGAQAVDQLRTTPTRARNELMRCGGTSVSRLAIGISEIYPYALAWQFHVTNEPLQVHKNSSEKTPLDYIPGQAEMNSTSTVGMTDAHKITESVFGALDLVWAETSPALTPSAYAYLATAELRMLKHAFSYLRSSEHRQQIPASNHEVIEMTPVAKQESSLPSLNEDSLQERYSRALSRTALVIKSSHNYLVSKLKGSQEVQSAIVELLLEATELVKQETLEHENTAPRFGTAPSSHLLDEEISLTTSTEDNVVDRVT